MDIRKITHELVNLSNKERNIVLESIEGNTEEWAHEAEDFVYKIHDILRAVEELLGENQFYKFNGGKWLNEFKKDRQILEENQKKYRDNQEKMLYERLKKKFDT